MATTILPAPYALPTCSPRTLPLPINWWYLYPLLVNPGGHMWWPWLTEDGRSGWCPRQGLKSWCSFSLALLSVGHAPLKPWVGCRESSYWKLPHVESAGNEAQGAPAAPHPSCLSWSSVQFSCSVVSDSATQWIVARQAYLSNTNSRSLPNLMSIELVMPSNYLILWHPLLLLPSIFPSIRVFSNESALCIRWPKYWSFSFNISPSSEHLGLISFRMDWLDLLAVQGILPTPELKY